MTINGSPRFSSSPKQTHLTRFLDKAREAPKPIVKSSNPPAATSTDSVTKTSTSTNSSTEPKPIADSVKNHLQQIALAQYYQAQQRRY